MAPRPVDLPLRCRCGHLRGVASDVAPGTGFRFLCYCKDCQTFARFLERTDVLDAAGGTDIVHMPPRRLRLVAGTDVLRCLCLSDRGVLRWYADCCRTPIANSAAGPRFPAVGVIHSFMDHASDGRPRETALGPPLCRIFEQSAVGALSPDVAPPSLGTFASRGKRVVRWWATGLARPNPFFDARTGAPIVTPHRLTASERAALWSPVQR